MEEFAEETKRQCFCGNCYWCLHFEIDRLRAEVENKRQQVDSWQISGGKQIKRAEKAEEELGNYKRLSDALTEDVASLRAELAKEKQAREAAKKQLYQYAGHAGAMEAQSELRDEYYKEKIAALTATNAVLTTAVKTLLDYTYSCEGAYSGAWQIQQSEDVLGSLDSLTRTAAEVLRAAEETLTGPEFVIVIGGMSCVQKLIEAVRAYVAAKEKL